MIRIFKYSLGAMDSPLPGPIIVEAPEGATTLSVGSQNGNFPSVWMLVDDEKPLAEYRFWVFGTGWEINTNDVDWDMQYVGRATQGWLEWHVFQESL